MLTKPRLHFDVHPGAGPPVLMVHGIMAGRALWAANIEALKTVSTPVVVELFGHGRSPAPTDVGAYSPDAYVAQFEAIREELGAKTWFVIGQSLGAALTLRYVIDHGDRVIAHVFTNSVSAAADAQWRARIVATVEEAARALEEGGLAAISDSRMNPVRARSFHPHVRAGLIADQSLLSPLGLAATMRHTVPNSSMRDQVSQNQRPCLLVAGEREKAFAEPLAHIKAVMANLTVVQLPVGHSPNAEAPEAFDAAVTAFFRSHLETAPVTSVAPIGQ